MNKTAENHIRIKFRELVTDLLKDAPLAFHDSWNKTIIIDDFSANPNIDFTFNGNTFSLLPPEMQKEAKRLFGKVVRETLYK
jgi:hypothetical protein